jgi:uncharacterized protein
MKKPIIITLIVLCAFVAVFSARPDFKSLVIGSHRFAIEIADTPEKHTLGLMFRQKISDDFGMLFVFPDDEVRFFWMKNTLVHLDIIYLNRNKQVIEIARNVPPCQADPCPSYSSVAPARYVLEIRGNLAAELQLKVGDKIFFQID